LRACGAEGAEPVGRAGAVAGFERELALGEVRVGVRDGRVTVECREAPRGLVVERLAREARFELFGALDAKPPRSTCSTSRSSRWSRCCCGSAVPRAVALR
jgi:hypothetical protein